MINSLKIGNLKGFEEYEINFSRLNLLVGGNNSGKTTIFHALQLFFWCVDQTTDIGTGSVTLKKTQVPELGGIPYFLARDLFFKQRTRVRNAPTRITLSITADGVPDINFKIYPAFSRNLMVDGGNTVVTPSQFATLTQLKPVYVPGTIGITVREEMYREVAQERLILEGRQNQVLRNLVYRLKQQESVWEAFVEVVTPLFKLQGLDVPFDNIRDEWMTAVYTEDGCTFDLISAGSGFLQVINLLSFLFLHTSRVALLDEPDSHMHDDLQKLTFDLLDKLSQDRNIQLIIATHSPTFIDSAGLNNILLIDRGFKAPLQAQEVDKLVPLLGDRGIALPPTKVMNTLKSRRVLFVEGYDDDYSDFVQRLGEKYKSGFGAETRGLTVFETTGATQKWPFDAIDAFQKLIGVPLKYVFLSDRDFLTDQQIADREARATSESKSIIHLHRRHRESYLLEPKIIARLVKSKWEAKIQDGPLPANLDENAIKEFILNHARSAANATRARFQADQDANLRLPAAEKVAALEALNEFFEEAYTNPLSANEIPYKLLDAKQTLKALRTHISDSSGISFSDREIIESFQQAEIPTEIKTLLGTVLSLFTEPQIRVRRRI
jgi:hypothetical protein